MDKRIHDISDEVINNAKEVFFRDIAQSLSNDDTPANSRYTVRIKLKRLVDVVFERAFLHGYTEGYEEAKKNIRAEKESSYDEED